MYTPGHLRKRKMREGKPPGAGETVERQVYPAQHRMRPSRLSRNPAGAADRCPLVANNLYHLASNTLPGSNLDTLTDTNQGVGMRRRVASTRLAGLVIGCFCGGSLGTYLTCIGSQLLFDTIQSQW